MNEKNQEEKKLEKNFNLVNVKIMINLKYKDFINSGVHFGHMAKKWNPNMSPFILMKKYGIHIIDIRKTLIYLNKAALAIKFIIQSGKKIMFIATKKQIKNFIKEESLKLNMPYITERWLGGMLTNFFTIKKLLKKMFFIDKIIKENSYQNFAKREKLMLIRKKNKLEKLLGGISSLVKLPSALFIIDINKEHIAVKEAQKVGIITFAIVDTNVNPNLINYPIPGNDDSFKSVSLIIKYISSIIQEAIDYRKKIIKKK